MHFLHLMKYKWQRRLLRVIVMLVMLLILYNVIFLPGMLSWGASQTEFNRVMPGDELVKSKDYKNTLAITVQKPASHIWPWVAQMGLNKAGFYSYTWLENMFGCKLKNADRIHPEWQNPNLGYQEGVCQSAVDKQMPGWIVAVIEPGRSFVWKGKDGDWMMGVYIDSIDDKTSRLITRMIYQSPKPYTGSWLLEKIWFEWAHCLMQNGMIRGIKKRAEQFDI